MNSFRSFFFALTCVHGIFTAPATAQTLPDYLPTDGLVAWYPFNGNANDESGNGNDGVVNGATLTEDRDGNQNAAYSFDGVDDYISVSSSPVLSFTEGEFSFSLWCKVLSLDVDRAFLDRPQSGNRYNLRCRQDGRVRVVARNAAGEENYADSGESLLVGEVYHVVGVHSFSQASISIFLNGEVVPNELLVLDITDPSISPDIDLFLGKYGTSASYFHGTIDDIAIYNRALSAEEVQTLYVGASDFPGCTYADACNYDSGATVDDGTCTFPAPNYDCSGNCLLDLNNNGLCDLEEAAGCTNVDAINYNADATLDDGSCMVTCKGDFDNDGQITINDLLGFLAAYGNQCEGAGCMDPSGCNYDPNSTFDLGYCEYPAEFFNCDGTPVNDTDGDGVADELEVAGCTDPEACNYDALATDDNGNCELPTEFFNCQGAPINDADGDGVPDELEVLGCTESDALNYNPDATDDDGSCTFGLTGPTHSCGAANVHNPNLIYGSVTDIDGNTYRTIVIGGQEWMAENLAVEHYANGDDIPQIVANVDWNDHDHASTGAWCSANNSPCAYGNLYNGSVVIDNRNVCPTGWHVPTNTEWTTLTNSLGGQAGGKMKSIGTSYWAAPNTGATNVKGFSGLPSGRRGGNGTYSEFGLVGWWWSSTTGNSPSTLWTRYVGYGDGILWNESWPISLGNAIRCLKD